MADVTVYFDRPYRAGLPPRVAFEEIDVEAGAGLEETMVKRSGGRTTVPQIFIGDRHVGGCDDLVALDDSGELDRLLGL